MSEHAIQLITTENIDNKNPKHKLQELKETKLSPEDERCTNHCVKVNKYVSANNRTIHQKKRIERIGSESHLRSCGRRSIDREMSHPTHRTSDRPHRPASHDVVVARRSAPRSIDLHTYDQHALTVYAHTRDVTNMSESYAEGAVLRRDRVEMESKTGRRWCDKTQTQNYKLFTPYSTAKISLVQNNTGPINPRQNNSNIKSARSFDFFE